jgi:molybdopterin synthase catalytic subunit
MDYLKTRAPFWKQVAVPTGTAWVDAKTADDTVAERWTLPPRREAAK